MGRGQRELLKELVQERVDAAKAASATTSDELPGEATGNSPSTNLAPEEETFKKRYGDLRRYVEQIKRDSEKEIATLRAQLNATTNGALQLPKSEAEVSAWMKQYPDVAAIVETIAARKANEAFSNSSTRVEQLEQEVLQTRIEKAEAIIKQLHPDFDQLKNDQKFHDWVSSKSKAIQDAVYDNPDDPYALSDVIEQYKSVTGKSAPKARTNSDLEASRAVRPSSAPTEPNNGQAGQIKESWVNKLQQAEYEKYEAKIEKAIRDGNFIYDVSGKR